MTEKDFLDLIDCNFPYADKEECLKLIDLSISISSDAVFAVVEEICRLPQSQRQSVSQDLLLELLHVIDKKFDHPIKNVVFDTARIMIKNEELSVDDAISRIEQVIKYPEQFHARSIIYFSCDDVEGKLEQYF